MMLKFSVRSDSSRIRQPGESHRDRAPGPGFAGVSIFSNDPGFTQNVVLGIGDLHGRILVIDSSVGNQHTGHGNVVPSCLHGGQAGRAEEKNLPGCERSCFTIAAS